MGSEDFPTGNGGYILHNVIGFALVTDFVYLTYALPIFHITSTYPVRPAVHRRVDPEKVSTSSQPLIAAMPLNKKTTANPTAIRRIQPLL